MTVPTADNAGNLRRALSKGANEINLQIHLDRIAAEQILTYLEAKNEGIDVSIVPTSHAYTTTQAAEILGMSRVHLTRLIKEGRVRAHKVGAHYRITARELEAQQNIRKIQDSPHSQELEDLWDEMGADN